MIPFIIIFLCLIIPENDYNNINIGIAYSDESSISNKIVDVLKKDENFKYEFYDLGNIDEMKRNIASNKLHIGYIIPEDIEDVINNRNFKDIIIKLISPSSYLNAITDEAICSTVIQVLSPYYADNFLYESNLIDYDASIMSYMIDSASDYLKDGDIMKFEAYYENGHGSVYVSSWADNIFIFACLIISLCMLTGNLLISSFNAEYNNRLFNYYKSSGKSVYIIKSCYYSALSVISLVYAFVSLLLLTIFIDVSESLYCSALIMFLSYSVFTGGLCSLVSKYSALSKIIHIAVPLILFSNFLLSGFFVSTKHLGDVINMISYVFPSKYFLTGLLSYNMNIFSIEFLINPMVLIATGLLLFVK